MSNEPYRIETKRTMAFELVEQSGDRRPDWILLPTGGGLAVVVSVIGGSLLGGALSSLTEGSGLVGIVSLLLPLGLLIAAIVRWRKMPGFILGIGLTFAIVIVTFGACIAIITASGGFQL